MRETKGSRMEEPWDKRCRGEQWKQNNKGTSKKTAKTLDLSQIFNI